MPMPTPAARNLYVSPRRQRGAVLFVGLIFLLLLTLLGVTGMQVTVLQERMAGNFRVAHQAFEQTEGQVAGGQADVRNVLVSLDTYTTVATSTGTNPTPWESWLTDTTNTPQLQILRRYCGAGCSDGLSAPTGADPERQVNFYVLSGQDFDPGTISTAIVQSVYVY
jgi:type IV pilus assembly protein PilX